MDEKLLDDLSLFYDDLHPTLVGGPGPQHVEDAHHLSATKLMTKYKSEYGSWRNAKYRAKDDGREFSERFERFEDFLMIMGPKPHADFSLDRIDNDKGYTPDNCRWASPKTQAENRRIVKQITVAGRTETMTEWARETGQSPSTLSRRRKRGLSDAEVVCTSVNGEFTVADFIEPWRLSKHRDEWNDLYAKQKSREAPCEFYYRVSKEQEDSIAAEIWEFGNSIDDVPESQRSKIEPRLKLWSGYREDAERKLDAWRVFTARRTSNEAVRKARSEVRKTIRKSLD